MASDGQGLELLERDASVAALRRRFDRALAGEGSLVLVEGSAGVGKTTLLRRMQAEATAAGGVRVLRAIGGELEREFAFGLVRQLFEPVVLGVAPEERERLFAGAAGRAAPVIAASPVDFEPSADAGFATLHGLYWLTAALAEELPLVLVVDDAHWADAPSLRFLDFLARRLPELAVLLVVGLRPAEPGAERDLLAGLAAAPEVEVLRPLPLSVAAVRSLVDAGVGERSADEVVAGAHRATGGNPLLLRELVRALAEAGARPTLADVRDAVPSSVTRSVERRLARLTADARTTARALAVLGDRLDRVVLAAATGLDEERVAEALELLRETEFAEGDPPRFVHPLVAQAVAASVTRDDRDRLHHRAATALHQRRGSEDQVVVHLLAASPLGAGWAVPVLRASARLVLAEGAPEAAVRRLLRAVEEGGAEGAAAGELWLDLGRAAASAGDPRAAEYLATAAAADDPATAAQATEAQMNVGAFDAADGLRGITTRLRAALERLGPGADPVLRERLLGQLLNALFVDARLAGERAGLLATLEGEESAGVLAHRAWEMAAGDASAEEARSIAGRALAGRPFRQLAAVEQPTPIWAVLALIGLDGAEEADRAIADAEATLRRIPTVLGRSYAAFMRAEWLLAFGSAAAAESEARQALELFERSGNVQSVVSGQAALTSALILRGALDEAEAVMSGVPGDDHFEVAWGGGLVWASRAELRIAQGRAREAVDDLRRVEAFCARYGWRRYPRGSTASLARALVLAGDVAEGRALAAAQAADARRRRAPRLEAQALIALGLASPGEAGLDALRAAVDVAERSPSSRVRSVAAFELGAALRRANRRAEAREYLAAARDLAHRIDAAGLVARASEELTVAGGRPRRIARSGAEALSPSERRVAEHAARGLTNREIAEALFVTRKTVEFQLGAAYSKLGIRSRTQLPAALAPG